MMQFKVKDYRGVPVAVMVLRPVPTSVEQGLPDKATPVVQVVAARAVAVVVPGL
jgi:hypothetical protein